MIGSGLAALSRKVIPEEDEENGDRQDWASGCYMAS